ncbi:hypothetical protein Tco_1111763 [Tanacetum coccineum]|uniref:Uncharacterized protein n=1 Tax=Tanacetum coccineum TaxID=301880 RepID=A0ABQ5IMK0_9ASTR
MCNACSSPVLGTHDAEQQELSFRPTKAYGLHTLCRKQSLSPYIPQSQLSPLQDPSRHRDVCVLAVSAAAPITLSNLTLRSRRVVSSSSSEGGVSSSEYQLCGSREALGLRVEYMENKRMVVDKSSWDQVHTLENMVPARDCLAASTEDPQWDTP